MHDPDFFEQLLFGIVIDAFAVIFQIHDRRQGIRFTRDRLYKILSLNTAIAAKPIKMISTDQKALFAGLQPVFLKLGIFKITAFCGF